MSDSEDELDSEIELTYLAFENPSRVVRTGGNLARYFSCFSPDGKILFLCVVSQVKMYSVASGEQVGVLRGHTAAVTGVMPNPKNSLQVYTASHDGSVRVWDFYEAKCLAEYDVGAPVLNFCLCRDIFVLNINKSGDKSQKSTSSRLATLRVDGDRCEAKIRFRTKACCGIAVSPNNDFVATISKSTITIWDVFQDKRIKYSHARNLTSVAFHPTEPYVATGDQDGQIIFWYRFNQPEELVTSILHWHAHAVHSLRFTEDGAYLLSGGEEAVLVSWQLGTGNKHFVPRLGSTIKHISISPDGNLVALSCADNSIRVVSTVTNQVHQHIKGLQHTHSHPVPKNARNLLTGLVRQPKNNLLVLGGMPGMIQFYDVFEDRHIMEVDIVNRNLVSRTDSNAMVVTRVELLAVNRNGSWLATLERRVNCETSDTICLKFFSYDATSSSYSLHTRIDNPHNDRVVAIDFHPRQNVLVTASVDRTFKLWEEQAPEKRPSLSSNPAPQKSFWNCRSIGEYRGFKVNHATFSLDGSLLAVSHGQVVTLWDAARMSLLHTLLHPPPAEHVRKVAFVTDSPFLVAMTGDSLYVWNLLTASVWWSCSVTVSALAVDPGSSHFAIITTPMSDPQGETFFPLGDPPLPTAPQSERRKYSKARRLQRRKMKEAFERRQQASRLLLFDPRNP